MSLYLQNQNRQEERVKIESDLCNYATKEDLKNARGIDTSDFVKKIALANLKSDVDR